VADNYEDSYLLPRGKTRDLKEHVCIMSNQLSLPRS